MKHKTAIYILMIFLAPPLSYALMWGAAMSGKKLEQHQVTKFEATEREATAQSDAWKGYQLVSLATPAHGPDSLLQEYHRLAMSLALKAAMACSPDALRHLERNDVIEFRILRSSITSACRNT
jgi:hypothetical protein